MKRDKPPYLRDYELKRWGELSLRYFAKQCADTGSVLLCGEIPYGLIQCRNNGELRQRASGTSRGAQIDLSRRLINCGVLVLFERTVHGRLSTHQRCFSSADTSGRIDHFDERPNRLWRHPQRVPANVFDHGLLHKRAPPSTAMSAPVMKAPAGAARSPAICATSSGIPARCMGFASR